MADYVTNEVSVRPGMKLIVLTENWICRWKELNDDENKITFENLWNVIFLMAHNQLVDKHRNRFPSLSAPEKESPISSYFFTTGYLNLLV